MRQHLMKYRAKYKAISYSTIFLKIKFIISSIVPQSTTPENDIGSNLSTAYIGDLVIYTYVTEYNSNNNFNTKRWMFRWDVPIKIGQMYKKQAGSKMFKKKTEQRDIKKKKKYMWNNKFINILE